MVVQLLQEQVVAEEALLQHLLMDQEILVDQVEVDLFLITLVHAELVVKEMTEDKVIILPLQDQMELDQAVEVELEEQEAMPLHQDRIQHQERAELEQT